MYSGGATAPFPMVKGEDKKTMNGEKKKKTKPRSSTSNPKDM